MKIELNSLLYQILQIANSGRTRSFFLREISTIILDFFKCTEVVQLLKVPNDQPHYELLKLSRKTFVYNILDLEELKKNNNFKGADLNKGKENIWVNILQGKFNSSLPFFTEKGTFWINDLDNLSSVTKKISKQESVWYPINTKNCKSLVIVPFLFSKDIIGLLQLKNIKKKLISEFEIEEVEEFAHTLGVILLNQYSQAALQERVKELICLYGMSRVAKQIDISLEDLLYRIMELIPPAWQYPELTQTRIILDGFDFSKPEFEEGQHKLWADIVVKGEKRGVIEVVYVEKCPELDEGPFLREERKLIDTIANELAIIIKRRDAAEEKINLKNQLHHADRLSTVGELAAGVAHELNEPLGSIMGFAQLASKCHGVPQQVEKDLEKIVKSSLHAREIIKRLMSFSKDTLSEKKETNINQLVEESIYFFKSRCHKEGIVLSISLEPDLPIITVDPVQIEQVLVNIIVNAMHAMQGGGKLDIQTRSNDGNLNLIVKDTGHGMNQEVMEKIFDPFFTTKKMGKGIGLGLSVVKGIIASHNGNIKVESEPGKGTRFEVNLPITKNQYGKVT